MEVCCEDNKINTISQQLDELLNESNKEPPPANTVPSNKKFTGSKVLTRCRMSSSVQNLGKERHNDQPVKSRCTSENRIESLIKENAKLCGVIETMRRQEQDTDESARKVRQFLLRAEEDKKRLAQRIENLTSNERTLVLEIERLKRRGGIPGERPLSQKRLNQLTDHITGLEQDRDYWRSQVELLNQVLSSPEAVGNRMNSKERNGHQRIASANVCRSRNESRGRREKIEGKINDLRASRSELKQQNKKRPITSEEPVPRSRSLPREQACDDLFENQKLRLERNELQSMLNRFERRIREIQENVQTLTRERDHLHKLYTEAKNEIHRLHHDLYTVQNSSSQKDEFQETIRRLTTELDRAQEEIGRIAAERDGCVVKYKNAKEAEAVDQQRHHKQMDYLERALSETITERDEVMGRIGQLKRKLEDLQCNQMQIEQRLGEKNEKLKKDTEQIAELRKDREAKMKLLEEAEEKLTASRQRSGELELVCGRMETKLEETSRRFQKEQEETRRLRAGTEEIMNERDKLQQDVEELRKTSSQLQKANKYMEKKYLATVTERDEVNTNCNILAGDIRELEQKLRILESDSASVGSKLQLERAKNEDLTERCSEADRRLETSEARCKSLTNQHRDFQDGRFQMERQLTAVTDKLERLKATADRMDDENVSLKNIIDLANKDKIKLEAYVEELTTANRQLVRERDDVVHRSALARERISELEAENRIFESDLKTNGENLENERKTVAELRNQCDVLRQQSSDKESDLADLQARCRNTEERLNETEIRANQLERELRLEHDDYLQMRSRLEVTEEQRDAHEATSKQLNQRIIELESKFSSQMKELKDVKSELEAEARVAVRKNEQLQTALASEQTLKSELAAAQSGFRECKRAAESADKENNNLRNELSDMVRDIQRLEAAYHETLDERDDLKRRLDGYFNEISRLERLLAERDRERDLLGDQLRAANEDAEVWRSRWEKAETDASSTQINSDEKDLELARTRDTIEVKGRELALCRSNMAAMETQIRDLSKQRREATEAGREASAEVETLTNEISRLREALTRNESARTTNEREVITCHLELDQLRAKVSDLESNLKQANETMITERENARKVNTTLQECRDKELAACQEVQERTNEVIMLRERAVTAEERADAHLRESTRLYGRLAESEKEATLLSRDLSTERIGRERLASTTSTIPPRRSSPYSSSSPSRYTVSRLRSPPRTAERQ